MLPVQMSSHMNTLFTRESIRKYHIQMIMKYYPCKYFFVIYHFGFLLHRSQNFCKLGFEVTYLFMKINLSFSKYWYINT